MRRLIGTTFRLAFVLAQVARHASAQTRPPPELATATLENLMAIVVTTASRAPEGLAAAPARVQVVTAAQIERRGYRSVLDVLKDLADFKVDLLMATTEVAGSLERRTLAGYATIDVNVRRNLSRTLDAFLTIENALDCRYRTLNLRAYTGPGELNGAPQNPRRVSIGLSLRLPRGRTP